MIHSSIAEVETSERVNGDRQPAGKAPVGGKTERNWTFLSNHSHVLLCLARDPRARLRDVANQVQVTERAVQKIIRDLEAGGALTREREGRRNRYRINLELPLRHPVEAGRSVRELLLVAMDEAQVASVPPTSANDD